MVNEPSKSKQLGELSSPEDQLEQAKVNVRSLATGIDALERVNLTAGINDADDADDHPTLRELQTPQQMSASSTIPPVKRVVLTPVLVKLHTLAEALVDGLAVEVVARRMAGEVELANRHGDSLARETRRLMPRK
eukprot:1152616-Prorocentrum_minimum.AAC.1